MQETIKLEMTKSEAEQFNALLEAGLREMDASFKRMDQYEAETLQLQAETRAMLSQLEVMFNVETSI
ncbi:MAG: hypothetical protein KA368_23795 [Acidobacteria bacterium]|nr:hypothetical protein [Acidobacteriota bacterium]